MRQTFPPMSTKFEIHRRRQVPFIAYQNTSILPLYVLGKRIDVPSCNVEFNERKVDWHDDSRVRYVLKIHFFIEFGLKMIQFKIQFKTKSKIFIQKNIHSKQNPKYSFKKIFIQ